MDTIFKNMFANDVSTYKKVNTGFAQKLTKVLSTNQQIGFAQISIFMKGFPNNSVTVGGEVISMSDIGDTLKLKNLINDTTKETLKKTVKKVSSSFSKEFFENARKSKETLEFCCALTKELCCVGTTRLSISNEATLAAYLFSLLKFSDAITDTIIFGYRLRILSDVMADKDLQKRNKGIVEFVVGVITKQYYIMCESMVDKEYGDVKVVIEKVLNEGFTLECGLYGKPVKQRNKYMEDNKKSTDSRDKYFKNEKNNLLLLMSVKGFKNF